MKKWLREKLLNLLREPEPNVGMNLIGATASKAVATGDGIDMDNSLRFNVLVGSGGIVLQLYRYDRKTDRSNNATHIIPDHENIAERIGQIVSLEILKG